MDWMKAVRERHSVRRYTDRPIEGDVLKELRLAIEKYNREGGLRMQLRLNEDEPFRGFLASYGLLHGVRNYVALIGEDRPDLDERVGYYGEKLVLHAQLLGLNTCWVGGSYRKGKAVRVAENERLVCVLAIGYGANQGHARRSKPMEKLCCTDGEMPEWFRMGMEAAMLAPTAVNQQRFMIEWKNGILRYRAYRGLFSAVDLGIVKLHFEIGADASGLMPDNLCSRLNKGE